MIRPMIDRQDNDLATNYRSLIFCHGSEPRVVAPKLEKPGKQFANRIKATATVAGEQSALKSRL